MTADGQPTNQNVFMSYNDVGEPTTLTYPDGEIVASTYDSKGYFRGMSISNRAIVSAVQYTNTGQAAGMTIGGVAYQGTVTTPVQVSLGYDSLQRVISDSVMVAGNSLFSQTQTYDNVGNVLQLSTTLPTSSGSSLTDNQSYCYDALNRLMWAGNSGTPTGGDHCGSTPGGSTTPGYSQSFSYDVIDRLLSGTAGTVSYADASHVHAATSISTIPNQYASYDAMGNMTCRTVDTTGVQSCASATPTGATMSYDNEGRLTTWTAPGGSTESDQFLYDAGGNRVLQRSSATPAGSSTLTITDTITYDGYTDTTISNGTTTTIKYYQVGGQIVAEATGTAWYSLVPDLLKNTALVLKSDGTVQAVQLYAPYGSMRYTDGTIPTPSNFTGQRLDAQTGLLYYNSRYYDPVSGRFTSTDTVQTNAQGADTYAYVNDNPVGRTDPTGHCPWCIIGAVAGALIGAVWSYGSQVYNNYQSGDANPWTDVNWLDVGGAALVGGLIGFGLGPMIPAVGAMIGGTVSTGSIGAGLAAGGGAFAAASGWLSGGVSSPEATQPEATQPEATQPEIPQPEAPQPEAPQPEVPQPEANQSTNIENTANPELKMTNTVTNHFDEIRPRSVMTNGVTRFFKGDSLRPYVNSPGTNSLIRTIMEGDAYPDPQGIPNALRWDCKRYHMSEPLADPKVSHWPHTSAILESKFERAEEKKGVSSDPSRRNSELGLDPGQKPTRSSQSIWALAQHGSQAPTGGASRYGP